VPELPGNRFLLYVGTGGPGHIDPSLNRGDAAESQGIDENPSWEKPFHALLQAILDDERAALLAVCHTFGVVCRWSGAAEPVVRGADKGGKSSGLVENVLTEDALEHPWFSRFAAELPDGRSLTVIDSRYFDLLPRNGMPRGATAIGYEAEGPEVRSLTMLELARDRGGIMPRVFAVNHHPEVVDRAHAMTVLELMWRRGDVTGEWYAERAATLKQTIHGRDVEALLRLTSQFTFLFPLQFHLSRVVRLRMEALGLEQTVSETAFLEKLMSYARESVRIE
jgi:hypothetical protein